jgi:putative NADPH-quinone reductase
MEGLLGGKKALLINTAMGSEQDYETSGVKDAMRTIAGALLTEGCGIQNLEQVFYYAVHDAGDEIRKGYLESAHSLGQGF